MLARWKEDVVFAASHGGHLGQALRLRVELPVRATVVTTDVSSKVLPAEAIALVPSLRGMSSWVRNAVQSARLALALRPRLIVSFGCRGVAFFTLWSRLLGARLVLVESFARVRTPSRFVRVFAPLAHRLLVQWPDLINEFPNATLVQSPYSFERPRIGPVREVFVVVGTYREGMDRLLQLVDHASPLPGKPHIVCQIGYSRYLPEKADWFRWRNTSEFRDLVASSDVIITHDGSNTIAQALEAGRPIIVIPRSPDELDYESNAELSTELEGRKWVIKVSSPEELRDALEHLDRIVAPRQSAATTMASCVLDEMSPHAKIGSVPRSAHGE